MALNQLNTEGEALRTEHEHRKDGETRAKGRSGWLEPPQQGGPGAPGVQTMWETPVFILRTMRSHEALSQEEVRPGKKWV